MSHQKPIDRTNPTCFLFLIDQSASMNGKIGGRQNGTTKKTFVADVLNKTIRSLVIRASKGVNIRRYYQVGIIGYGSQVRPRLAGNLSGRDLVWIDEIDANPLRVDTRIVKEEDGAGGLCEASKKFPVWFVPEASGNTPMCGAVRKATEILGRWLRQYPASYPPTVVNLTDGEANDGNPVPLARTLKSMHSSDGHVTLWTLHVSSHGIMSPIVFPGTASELPDEHSRRMFEMSSEIPANQQIRMGIEEWGIKLSNRSRAMVLNAGIEEIVNTFDIGTRHTNVRSDVDE